MSWIIELRILLRVKKYPCEDLWWREDCGEKTHLESVYIKREIIKNSKSPVYGRRGEVKRINN